MGHAKTNMKRIQNEKARKTTFVHRKKGLSKKVLEFSSIFGAEHQKIKTTIEEFGVKDYYANKKNLVEAQISRVRKEILKKKYPTSSPIFHNSEEKQLKAFSAFIDSKIETNQLSKLVDWDDMKVESEEFTSFIQNTMQNITYDNVLSSHLGQLDVNHNISQMQNITGCMLPLYDDICDFVDCTDLID
ncbi:uncharacterized protein [Cicer arietinum]|uniref:Uncharacterized protein LOC101513970 n=1 Tax=Cicer arietinum TaxID=3827 RepID=A0A1S2XH36_CICAR|nr:uncharacterized protein LOC101513970 [Cicer arietinum]